MIRSEPRSNLIPVTTPIVSSGHHRLSRKRSYADAVCSANRTQMFGVEARKKLRRLPHVFSRVLELPLKSDADVSVEVNPSNFRFVVAVGNGVCEAGSRFGARVIQVYPGVVKVIVTGYGTDEDENELQLMDGLELDKWRFRLPVTTSPEHSTAVCVDGTLVVTVPKQTAVDGDGAKRVLEWD
uniref:SHSP domain-containing protein n=1 Tax=Kalanchoe fedtschenkoi TaxID=63787 RepID=A0A7N0V3F6_KALFE